MIDDDHPYANSPAEYEVHGKGMLGTYRFSGPASYVIKPFTDPDMVSVCYIHECNATRLNWVFQALIFLLILLRRIGRMIMHGSMMTIGDSIIMHSYHNRMLIISRLRIRILLSRDSVLKWMNSFQGKKIQRFITIFLS